jgi:hypothetical protein
MAKRRGLCFKLQGNLTKRVKLYGLQLWIAMKLR